MYKAAICYDCRRIFFVEKQKRHYRCSECGSRRAMPITAAQITNLIRSREKQIIEMSGGRFIKGIDPRRREDPTNPSKHRVRKGLRVKKAPDTPKDTPPPPPPPPKYTPSMHKISREFKEWYSNLDVVRQYEIKKDPDKLMRWVLRYKKLSYEDAKEIAQKLVKKI